jgi:hypothetical protein
MAEKTNGTAAPPAQEGLTKSEAVKRTFARLGKAAMPKAVQAEVKRVYGLDASPNLISTIKSELGGAAAAAKKPAGAKPVAKKQAANASATKAAAPVAAKPTPSANGKHPVVSIDDVLALKAIVGRVGAGHVKTLIDVMSL